MDPQPGSSRIPPRGPRTAVGIAEPEDPPTGMLEKLKLFLRKLILRHA